MSEIRFHRVVSNPEELYSSRENISVELDWRGVPLQICCRLLSCGLTDRRERMYFDHPQPPFTRLFVFETGGADLETPSGRFFLAPGRLHLLPPAQPFRVSYHVSRLVFFHLHVCDAAGRSLFEGVEGVPQIDDPELCRRFSAAMARDDRFALLCGLGDAVRQFLSPRQEELAGNAERFRRFALLFDYLRSAPPARTGVKELAELYRITPDTLSKRFRRATGMPLKRYLTEYLLRAAQELLLHSSLTVTAVASRLGYATPQYFHRFFLHHCGLTPEQYRQRQHRD